MHLPQMALCRSGTKRWRGETSYWKTRGECQMLGDGPGSQNTAELCYCTTFLSAIPLEIEKKMKRIHFHALHIPRLFNNFLEKPTNHRFSVGHSHISSSCNDSILTEENVNPASSRCVPHISTHPLAPRGIPASRRRREVVPCPFI